MGNGWSCGARAWVGGQGRIRSPRPRGRPDSGAPGAALPMFRTARFSALPGRLRHRFMLAVNPKDDHVRRRGAAFCACLDPGPVRAGHAPGAADSPATGSSRTGAMVSGVMRRARRTAHSPECSMGWHRHGGSRPAYWESRA